MLRARYANISNVERRYVVVDGRRVHYRVAGQGVPVILLHESPRSSLSLMPIIDELGQYCRVIAPDTPGFGNSQALVGKEQSLDEFANALLQFMNALKVESVSLYGTHTGAAIAAQFALNNPERVNKLVLDGFPIFTQEEKNDLLTNYLPALDISWDGSHVMRLWSRIKDLYTYFPYNKRNTKCRLVGSPPPLDSFQRTALGFLEAGNHYRGAYAAAFGIDGAKALSNLQVSTTVLAHHSDLLFDHLSRIPCGLSHSVLKIHGDRDEWKRCLRAELVSDSDGESICQEEADVSMGERRYLSIGGGQLHYSCYGSQTNPALLFFHDIPGSSLDFFDEAKRLSSQYFVVVPDLPGCADSDPLLTDALNIDDYSDVIDRLLSDLEISKLSVAGVGLGAEFALHFSISTNCVMEHGVLSVRSFVGDRETLAKHYLPPMTPALDGTHLTGAWFRLRDSYFYSPWYEQSGDARVRHDPCGNAELVHSKLKAVVKGPEAANLARSLFNAATPEQSELNPKGQLLVLNEASEEEVADELTRLDPLTEAAAE